MDNYKNLRLWLESMDKENDKKILIGNYILENYLKDEKSTGFQINHAYEKTKNIEFSLNYDETNSIYFCEWYDNQNLATQYMAFLEDAKKSPFDKTPITFIFIT